MQLASKWFHCIRVKGDVKAKDHFANQLFGRKAPAMLVSTWDGSKVIPIASLTPKSAWNAMSVVGKRAYEKSPDKAVKAWLKLLNKFDALDDKQAQLQKSLAECEAKNKRSKAKSLRKKIDKIGEDREKLFAQEKELIELPLKPVVAEEDES